jgi:predicted amidohydrolase YtcJ
VTHEYTILTGGVVLATGAAGTVGVADVSDGAPATAIAWAEDTILAIGDDTTVRAISRGDSRFIDLRGAVVVPLDGPLEPGSPADLAVLDRVSQGGALPRTLVVVRAGRVVEGAFS